MAQHTVGFIGFGNMAQAMAKGFLQAGVLEGAQIAACAKRWEKLEKTAGELGVIPCKDAVEVLERSDILILAVKPYLIETVLAPIREKLAGKVLLSVAAGWPFQRFEEVLPAGVHHLSIMPNTPVAIGEGIVLLEEENSLSPQELSQAKELLAALGVVEPKWASRGRWRAAARPTPPCSWRPWGTRASTTACPESFPTGWRPRCWRAPESSTWPQASTPAP